MVMNQVNEKTEVPRDVKLRSALYNNDGFRIITKPESIETVFHVGR